MKKDQVHLCRRPVSKWRPYPWPSVSMGCWASQSGGQGDPEIKWKGLHPVSDRIYDSNRSSIL